MSRAKLKGALLTVGILVTVVLVATFFATNAWLLTPAILIALAVQLASPVDDAPDVPNHPFKAWLFGACACGGVILVVVGATSKPTDLAIGALVLAMSLPALWMIHKGRNPWWMRGWADYKR